jgi:hypothetical protein
VGASLTRFELAATDELGQRLGGRLGLPSCRAGKASACSDLAGPTGRRILLAESCRRVHPAKNARSGSSA